MSNDTYEVVIDLATKKVTTVGILSYQGTFDVTLINIGTATPTNLSLQVLLNGTEMGAIAVGSLTASGSNAVGELDLDTENLGTHFSTRPAQAVDDFTLNVFDPTDLNLLVNDLIKISNNTYSG